MPGTELLISPPGRDPRLAAASAEVSRLAAAAAAYADRAKVPSTRRAYLTKWRQFEAWCELHQADALRASADVVALELTDLAPTKSIFILNCVLAAIGDAHLRMSCGTHWRSPSPVVRRPWSGPWRRDGDGPRREWR